MNNKIRSAFYSITTAYILFALLAVIFAVGSHLAGTAAIEPIFSQMNATHIWTCLGSIIANTTLLIWLLALVVIAGALFVNTLCCTSRLVKQSWFNGSKSKAPFRLQTMAFIHVIALLVIIFHALDVGLIQRNNPVNIMESESQILGKYRLQVNKISYVTDRKIITESETGKRTPSFKIPKELFSITDNKAVISLYLGEKLVTKSDIRLFDPLSVGGSFFILDGFFIPYNSDKIGLSIHYMYNPLVYPFFAIYIILFSALLFQWFKNRYRFKSINTIKTTKRSATK